MSETTAKTTVLLRYWAGAKAAAGLASEEVAAGSIGEAIGVVVEAHANPHFARVVRASALLVDGLTAHEDDLDRPLRGPITVEVMPPFAGGR